MLSVIKGIEPRDQIEAMLAAQMAAVHLATMTFARRLAHVENIRNRTAPRTPSTNSPDLRSSGRGPEALPQGGEQKMTVQHVHVAEGGQAIVGNVNAPPEGEGPRKIGGTTPCIGLCTWHRDAAPNRSGAGCNAARRPLGDLASVGCTGRPAAP